MRCSTESLSVWTTPSWMTKSCPMSPPKLTGSAARSSCIHVCKRDFIASTCLFRANSVSFRPISYSGSSRTDGTVRRLYLRRIANKLASERIDAEPVIVEATGTVAEVIKDFAEENSIDLIAMASRAAAEG